ncbi:MAG: hypothetical protein MI976_16690 [Pseudomonadales bacterium]|nr:hypothetical protein [Pseudomonadales bacterium]
MKKFVVCTRGCTASKWLSKSLELIPGFECTHGTAGLTTYDREYSQDQLLDVIHREWFERQTTPLNQYLTEQVRSEDARFIGNVHRYQVARHATLFTQAKDVQVANVIRHPVTWQDSRTALFMDLLTSIPHIGQQLYYSIITNFDFLRPFCQKHGINIVDPEFMAFIGSLVALPELIKDLQFDYPCFKMESIGKDAHAFQQLVSQITGGEYQLSDTDVNAIFGAQKMHQHRKGSGKNAQSTFATWPTWKKELFIPMLFETQAQEYYKSYDYDFSFMDECQEYHDIPQQLKANKPGGPFWINIDEVQ